MAKGPGFGTGFILGAIVGVLAGLLTAPRAGEEMLADLKERSEEWKERAEDLAARAQQRFQQAAQGPRPHPDFGDFADEAEEEDIIPFDQPGKRQKRRASRKQ